MFLAARRRECRDGGSPELPRATLTGRLGPVTIDTMKTISAVLRDAVAGSDLSLQRLSDLTGVERASLSRFVRAERSLRLDMADRLANFFGLQLQPVRKGRAGKD